MVPGRLLQKPAVLQLKYGADSQARALEIQEQARAIPMAAIWDQFEMLFQLQHEALESGSLVRAFAENIGSFPALHKITVVSATDGRMFNRLCETPAKRALPLRFSCPDSRGWPDAPGGEPKKWDDEGEDSLAIRTITRLLANNEDFGRVTALHIDTSDLCFGLNMSMLENDAHETFRHFEKVIARPGFKHLHLDLFTADDHYHRSSPGTILGRGLLKRALRNAANGEGLEYLHLRTNVFVVDNYMRRGDCYAPLGSIFDPVSLSTSRSLSHVHSRVRPVRASRLAAPYSALRRTPPTSFCVGRGRYEDADGKDPRGGGLVTARPAAYTSRRGWVSCLWRAASSV
ncbi:hypothetical protein BJ166DRAFT_300871 [Pestalotiopsis sp. NC0098]|nr:hypothetical protein BJ166DRAFT_300871 [Pestalotiopsis sp. NC0098]